nr:immunoglobulin light chain junction region [Macaca mulatta]MOX28434.1 immunoglobulin light chain junction region [Macaca mulatta]MOX28447.1 immunoglobulin light chain junction region [Macaca mulatta]MOX29112.1 immunoglobulin light chain junction region [Macaca mulatta]MOX30997.1 immunoglobulin light chain junction region [Macaca mulatta]
DYYCAIWYNDAWVF